MKNLIEDSIRLVVEAKWKLEQIKEKYHYQNNIEHEICENITRTNDLFKELIVLEKLLLSDENET